MDLGGENDYNEISNETYFAYCINLSYSGYKIDHQNSDTPLGRNNDKYTFYQQFYFSLDSSSVLQVHWNVIKYKEEKGLFGLFDNFLNKKNEYTSIDISNIEQVKIERILEYENEVPEIGSMKMKGFAFIFMKNEHNKYIEYIRNKKSILDVLADIRALFSALYSVFSFIFIFILVILIIIKL